MLERTARMSPSLRAGGPVKSRLRTVVTWSSWLYLGLLVVSIAALRYVGEDFWLTGVALYLPRVFFLAPCLVLLPFAFALRLPRVLAVQLVAALLVVFPLMGFVMPHPRASANGPQIRVMSYNVKHCHAGAEALTARIQHHAPDVVLLQEVCDWRKGLIERLREEYPVVYSSDQFVLATHYPLGAVRDPGMFEVNGEEFHERFARYELETPLGRVVFYNLHPLSPRYAFYALRGMRVRTSLREGKLWRGGYAEDAVHENFTVRERTLQTALDLAARDTLPRVLAGDTNLVGLSPMLQRHFAPYRDGFESAGWGFGYTFPSLAPWMRLDRIFASTDLRFVSFQTGCAQDSDHHCVVAQIER